MHIFIFQLLTYLSVAVYFDCNSIKFTDEYDHCVQALANMDIVTSSANNEFSQTFRDVSKRFNESVIAEVINLTETTIERVRHEKQAQLPLEFFNKPPKEEFRKKEQMMMEDEEEEVLLKKEFEKGENFSPIQSRRESVRRSSIFIEGNKIYGAFDKVQSPFFTLCMTAAWGIPYRRRKDIFNSDHRDFGENIRFPFFRELIYVFDDLFPEKDSVVREAFSVRPGGVIPMQFIDRMLEFLITSWAIASRAYEAFHTLYVLNSVTESDIKQLYQETKTAKDLLSGIDKMRSIYLLSESSIRKVNVLYYHFFNPENEKRVDDPKNLIIRPPSMKNIGSASELLNGLLLNSFTVSNGRTLLGFLTSHSNWYLSAYVKYVMHHNTFYDDTQRLMQTFDSIPDAKIFTSIKVGLARAISAVAKFSFQFLWLNPTLTKCLHEVYSDGIYWRFAAKTDSVYLSSSEEFIRQPDMLHIVECLDKELDQSLGYVHNTFHPDQEAMLTEYYNLFEDKSEYPEPEFYDQSTLFLHTYYTIIHGSVEYNGEPAVAYSNSIMNSEAGFPSDPSLAYEKTKRDRGASPVFPQKTMYEDKHFQDIKEAVLNFGKEAYAEFTYEAPPILKNEVLEPIIEQNEDDSEEDKLPKRKLKHRQSSSSDISSEVEVEEQRALSPTKQHEFKQEKGQAKIIHNTSVLRARNFLSQTLDRLYNVLKYTVENNISSGYIQYRQEYDELLANCLGNPKTSDFTVYSMEKMDTYVDHVTSLMESCHQSIIIK